MEIKANMNVRGVNGSIPPRQPAKAKSSTDNVSLGESAAVDSALQSAPNSRPEAVERARTLIDDPSYPSPETIKSVSTLLAYHLDSDNR